MVQHDFWGTSKLHSFVYASGPNKMHFRLKQGGLVIRGNWTIEMHSTAKRPTLYPSGYDSLMAVGQVVGPFVLKPGTQIKVIWIKEQKTDNMLNSRWINERKEDMVTIERIMD